MNVKTRWLDVSPLVRMIGNLCAFVKPQFLLNKEAFQHVSGSLLDLIFPTPYLKNVIVPSQFELHCFLLHRKCKLAENVVPINSASLWIRR